MIRRRAESLALVLTAILGLQKGNLALWQPGTEQPLQVFPYRCDTRPPEVLQSLEEGMEFSDLDTAREVAEDFCS